jgi:hypothetical protein
MSCNVCSPSSSSPSPTLLRALEVARIATALDSADITQTPRAECIAAYQDCISLLDDYIRWEAPASEVKKIADIVRNCSDPPPKLKVDAIYAA